MQSFLHLIIYLWYYNYRHYSFWIIFTFLLFVHFYLNLDVALYQLNLGRFTFKFHLNIFILTCYCIWLSSANVVEILGNKNILLVNSKPINFFSILASNFTITFFLVGVLFLIISTLSFFSLNPQFFSQKNAQFIHQPIQTRIIKNEKRWDFPPLLSSSSNSFIYLKFKLINESQNIKDTTISGQWVIHTQDQVLKFNWSGHSDIWQQLKIPIANLLDQQFSLRFLSETSFLKPTFNRFRSPYFVIDSIKNSQNFIRLCLLILSFFSFVIIFSSLMTILWPNKGVGGVIFIYLFFILFFEKYIYILHYNHQTGSLFGQFKSWFLFSYQDFFYTRQFIDHQAISMIQIAYAFFIKVIVLTIPLFCLSWYRFCKFLFN